MSTARRPRLAQQLDLEHDRWYGPEIVLDAGRSRRRTSRTDFTSRRKWATASVVSIPNPHDSLVQTVFSDLENAAGELRSVLPAAVVDKLNWTTLKLEPGTFVDPELRDRHTDLLYSVELKGSPKPGSGKHSSARRVFLYVLLEHQSSADRWMLLRLLRYMLRIWEWFLTNTP